MIDKYLLSYWLLPNYKVFKIENWKKSVLFFFISA